MGRKLRAGSIPQAPESPGGRTGRKMSIFPVMAGAKGRAGGGGISDEGDSSEDEQKSEEPEDQVLSAARKFKGLRISGFGTEYIIHPSMHMPLPHSSASLPQEMPERPDAATSTASVRRISGGR